MSKSFLLIALASVIIAVNAQYSVSSMLNYPLPLNGDFSSIGSVLNPLKATSNVVINQVGSYIVQVTNTTTVNNLVLGGIGANPTLEVVKGVTMTLMGLTMQSGSINLHAGAVLIINGAGLTVNGLLPVSVFIGNGAVLTTSAITVGSLSTGIQALTALTSLTVTGSGTLNLEKAVVNVGATANLLINAPVTIGTATTINTIAAAQVAFGGLVKIVGTAQLAASLLFNTGSSLIFSGVNSALTATNIAFMTGSTLVISAAGTVNSVLTVTGTLNTAATLILNVLANVSGALNIVHFGSIIGSFNVAVNTAFAVATVGTTVVATMV